MCEAHRMQPGPGAVQAPTDASRAPATGSRRRRVWDLPVLHHCALIGVCLSTTAARRLYERLFRCSEPRDDYEVHVGLVGSCRQRGPVADALQRELDKRHAIAIRRFATAKTADALQTQFLQAAEEGAIGASLWAALTHPRCDDAVAEAIHRCVHMHQHAAGAMARADLQRRARLTDAHAAAQAELERARERSLQLQAEKAAQIERCEAQLLRLRADVMARDSTIAALRHDLGELQRATPDLPARRKLAARVDELEQRNRALARELAEARQQLAEKPAAGRTAVPAPPAAAPAEAPVPAEAASLEATAVLCVGGRDRAVAVYRDLVEQRGGRFLHHDGGRADNPHLLSVSLAAADLVVCQAGCISHNAYWLVKDHCKRTGKRCIYLDRPSATGFARGLAGLPPAETALREE